MGACNCLARQSANPELVNDKSSSSGRIIKSNRRDGKGSEEDQIVKIQSAFRGHKVRKDLNSTKMDQYKKRVVEQLHAFIETCNQNSFVGKQPPFEYEENEEEDSLFGNRVFKGPTEIVGGGVYIGEWYSLLFLL